MCIKPRFTGSELYIMDISKDNHFSRKCFKTWKSVNYTAMDCTQRLMLDNIFSNIITSPTLYTQNISIIVYLYLHRLSTKVDENALHI